MGLGTLARPQGDKAQRPPRDLPEVVEEIEREMPGARDSPPQLMHTFVRRGDTVEVVEDEEVS